MTPIFIFGVLCFLFPPLVRNEKEAQSRERNKSDFLTAATHTVFIICRWRLFTLRRMYTTLRGVSVGLYRRADLDISKMLLDSAQYLPHFSKEFTFSGFLLEVGKKRRRRETLLIVTYNVIICYFII